jgi:hypothetical protein
VSIPVRLSSALAQRAREAAAVEDRSLTEQVEHWARLGELVEAGLRGATVRRLKTASHDEDLPRRLAAADTVAGRRRTAAIVKSDGGVRYGTVAGDPTALVRIEADGRRTAGRLEDGRFVPTRTKR